MMKGKSSPNIFNKMSERLRRVHPEHHAIARTMGLVAFFVLFGKLAGAGKEMAIAYRYGAGEVVDAYILIFNLLLLPISLCFTILAFVLLPLVVRIQKEAPADLVVFRAELFGMGLILAAALGLLAWIGLPILMRSSWTGLPLSTISIVERVVPVMVPILPLGVLISLLSVLMLAENRHINTLLEGIPAFCILLALLVWPWGGLEPLLLSTVAGFIIHFICLAVPLVRKGEITFPRFTKKSPHWGVFWQGSGIVLVGQSLMSFIGVVDQFFAADLESGSIATLGYTNRVLGLILALGATAISRATLPAFSRAKADGILMKLVSQWTRLTFFSGAFISILSIFIAPWGIKILFERGAFSATDTKNVTEVFYYASIQLPFYFAFLVQTSLLVSRRQYRLIALVAGISFVLKIGANYVLVPSLGINGIALATSVMYMASTLLCWFIIQKKSID